MFGVRTPNYFFILTISNIYEIYIIFFQKKNYVHLIDFKSIQNFEVHKK